MKDAFLNFVAGLQFVQYVGGMAVVGGLYGIVRGKIQGNRVKESFGYEACEEVVVPSGDLSPEA